MRRTLALGACLFLGALVSHPARADLVGTTVIGSLQFQGVGSNWFDPANTTGLQGVPASGFLNVSGPSVVVSASQNEFGYFDPHNALIVDFTGNAFSLYWLLGGGFGPATLHFTDDAFAGHEYVPSGGNVPGGLLTMLAGKNLTIQTPDLTGYSGLYSSRFQFTDMSTGTGLAAVPEPSQWALILAGGILGACRCFRLWRRRV